jgi:hypothetical protein
VAGQQARQADVVQFWRSVEFFAAPSLERPDPRENRFDVRSGKPLPWDSAHPLRRRPIPDGRVWRHTVYGGVFSLDGVHASLEEVFGSSGDDVDWRTPRGDSALSAVAVSADGRLLLDSLVLSAAAWAVAQAADPGPGAAGWLDGFDVFAKVGSLAGPAASP